jgi:Uma2 family endonuclease
MSQGVEGKPPTRGKVRRSAGGTVALAVPSDVRLLVSPEGFWRLCVANPELRLERTARGAIEAMPPASGGTGARNAGLTAQVVLWSWKDGTGTAFDSSAGFTLPNGAVRSPDASWIRNERWDALTAEQKEIGFAPICPDLVVELRSRTDRKKKLRKKMREYIAQGVRLGWLLDPIRGTVEIYRPGRRVERPAKPATLSGEDVLPGFVLDLKGILFD